MTGTLITFVILGFFLSIAKGQCGFPGRPLNGKVFTVKELEINETSWDKEQHLVLYRCDTGLLTVGHVRSDYYRECVNGTWTGAIPQCVEITENLKIFLQSDDTDAVNHTIAEPGRFFEIVMLAGDQRIVVNLPEKRHLTGIRISSESSQADVISFQKAKFLFVGDEENNLQIGYDRINYNDSTSFFIFTNLTEELSSISVELVHSDDFHIRHFEVYAFPNECGHPEIPINGSVNWQFGSPNATYSCNEGYALHSVNKTRTCENGRWTGSEPACKPISLGLFDRKITIYIACLLIFVAAVTLAYLFKKWCFRKVNKSDDAASDKELVYDAASSVRSLGTENEALEMDHIYEDIDDKEVDKTGYRILGHVGNQNTSFYSDEDVKMGEDGYLVPTHITNLRT